MYDKGGIISEGKTKRVFQEKKRQDTVIIQSKDDITAFDDKKFTKQFGSKGACATETTCRIFELLQQAGIPVAYGEQIGPLEFVARKCKMIPLEVVIRRYAVGSYLARHPELKMFSTPPHRFHQLVFELFFKTTGGKIITKNGAEWGSTWPDAKKEGNPPVEDPLIIDPYDSTWKLTHPKLPSWDKNYGSSYHLASNDFLPDGVTVDMIEEWTRKTFLAIEGAFTIFGYRPVDFKIEFGVTSSTGDLVVSDVIDNDSWRLFDPEWEEMSKEAFRQGEAISKVERKYGIVTDLVKRFRIPQQAIVVWRGSVNDAELKIPKVSGVDVVDIALSGHKSPRKMCARLEEVFSKYPEGGVIITPVGKSNSPGPTLSARTSWPVIAVPTTQEARPHDVWSSLEMPSHVPLLTVLSPKNAVLAALNILAQKNPIAYMHRQYEIEKFDI